ncbi:MAG TPA: CdaR family protein [Candidatus Limnocylindrales bacterium]|nr:CdaR family protein [Candidatus Limnocylindrales bacterium]
MTRVIGVILHNWPLKLAAVGLATLLYGGLVLSQSSATLTGVVPVDVRNQPPDTFLLQSIRPVTEIQYFTPANVRPIESDFQAWVDLADVDPSSGPTSVPVHLESIDPRVRVRSFEPQNVTVDLDQLSDKIVPVDVDHGAAPPTMTLGEVTVDPTQVHVKGPASVVERVAAARASVVIQSSGIDVDQDVELVAVDSVGDAVPQVNVDPPTAHVKIPVISNTQSKSLPVKPQVTGSPAGGFEISSVTVAPAIVTVEGDADQLQALAGLDTVPIPIGGFSETKTVDATLAPPTGVVVIDVQSVKVTIGIRAITGTRTFEVGVRIIGAQPGFEYDVGVDRVLLTVGGNPVDLDRIIGSTLAADLDVASLGPGTTDVTVGATLPPNVTLVAASPPSVPVTVIARPSASPSG